MIEGYQQPPRMTGITSVSASILSSTVTSKLRECFKWIKL